MSRNIEGFAPLCFFMGDSCSHVCESPAFSGVIAMRLVEEVYVKAENDEICQSCGIDIPKGSNHLLESYVHKGNITTSHYCLKRRCNPINNLRLKFFWGSIIVGLLSWVIYLQWFN